MKTLGDIFLPVATVAVAFFFAASFRTEAANITWTNTVSGGWNTAANWDPNTVPGATDTAIITNAGVTVTLDISPTVGGIILGTNGAGTVTLSLAGQTLTLDGPLTVNPSGSFTVDSGALIGNTNALLSGTIGWTAASLGGVLTLASGGTLNITSGADHYLPNCTFTNNGTVVWTGGRILGGGNPSGTQIYNNGLWSVQVDNVINNDYGGAGTTFNNLGTFRKSVTTGDTTIYGGVFFNQTGGSLDVQGGRVLLQSSGSFTGGTAANMAGTLVLNGGSFLINGTITSTNVQINGGTLAAGNSVINGGLNWVAGVWNGGGPMMIATNSLLLITSGNDHDLANCIFTNNGSVIWTGGGIRGGDNPSGTQIYNNGLFDVQVDNVINNAYGGAGTTFNNAGTFRKSVGTNTSSTVITGGVVFNQVAGVLDTQNGVLYLQGGGNFTGGYTTTNGTGTTYLNSGSFNLNGTVTSSNVIENAANLVGTNVIKGALTWGSGVWNGAVVTIAPNCTVIVAGGSGVNDMANSIVTNNGTVAWSSGTIRSGNGTAIYNYGLWDAQSDQVINNAYGGAGTTFNNYGTFRKSGGASEFANNTVFTGGVLFNQLAGVIDVQNGTNGLQLYFQGGGNLTGGYITTNVSGLTVLGAGNFTVNGTVTGTNTWENNGNLVGTNVINGGLTWVGGVWNGAVVTIAPNCTVIVAGGGGNNDMANSIVANNGTVRWASGTIRAGGTGTTIYNYGLWDAQSDQQMNNSGYGGNVVFNNYGTVRKSGGASEFANNTVFTGGVLFNQLAGVIDVQNGTNGLQLYFQGGGNLTGGYITTNSQGLTVLGAGNFTVNGTVTGTNTWEDAGDLVGNNVINGTLTWVAGSWNSAAVTIGSNSTVIVAGGRGNNDMANSIVTNNGTVTWASGTIRSGGNGTAIYNYGLWDAQSDQQMNNSGYGGNIVFNNYGTVRKSAGTGSTFFGGAVLFNQSSGLLSAQTGNILLQGGGNLIGGSISNRNFGTTYLNAGSFNLNGTVTSGNVIENAANLVGTNVINGALTWGSGVWNGAVVTIAPNSTVIVAGGNNDMPDSIVTNSGTVTWASGQIRGGGGAGTFIYNYGLWDAQSDQILNNSGYGGNIVFNNYGTVRKSAGTGSTFFGDAVTFNNTGKMDAQDGNIALQGAYTLANGTQMGFGLGGWLGNGSISLSGSALFSGSLSVNINGYFWPAVGGSFNLLNYTSESGVLFTNTVLAAPFTWQTNYNATAFTVTVVARPAYTNTASTNLYSRVVNGTTLYIAWPGDHTGWTLQAQTNPITVGLSTNWVAVLGSSVTNEFFIPFVNTNGAVFFRMVYP